MLAEVDALTEGRSALEAKVTSLVEERFVFQARVRELKASQARLTKEVWAERKLHAVVAQVAWGACYLWRGL